MKDSAVVDHDQITDLNTESILNSFTFDDT